MLQSGQREPGEPVSAPTEGCFQSTAGHGCGSHTGPRGASVALGFSVPHREGVARP